MKAQLSFKGVPSGTKGETWPQTGHSIPINNCPLLIKLPNMPDIICTSHFIGKETAAQRGNGRIQTRLRFLDYETRGLSHLCDIVLNRTVLLIHSVCSESTHPGSLVKALRTE